jgi:hypothetical protein
VDKWNVEHDLKEIRTKDVGKDSLRGEKKGGLFINR